MNERTGPNDTRRLCSGQPGNMNDFSPLLLVAIFAMAAFVNGVAATAPPSNTATHIVVSPQGASQAPQSGNAIQSIMSNLTPSQKAKMQQSGEYQAMQQMLQTEQQGDMKGNPLQQGALQGGLGPAVRPLNVTAEMDSDESGEAIDTPSSPQVAESLQV